MTEAVSSIEATEDWTLIALPALIAARRDQPSYHIFSEEHARGQIFNLVTGERWEPLRFDGNLLLLVVSGSMKISVNHAERTLSAGWQILLNRGVEFRIEATGPSSLEVIWTPPFAEVMHSARQHET
jgi:hypothetical protein